MKLNNVFYLVAISCITGLTAMNEPLTLEQYKNVLATGNCDQIVQATKQLWNSNTDGIHLHWTGREFQIAGGPKN